MNLTRFEELLAAYGADPARWPHAERAEAEHLRATSPDARALHDEAARLDSVLSRASAVSAPADLAARILAQAPAAATPEGRTQSVPAPAPSRGSPARWNWLRELWPGGAAWQPAAALAASMILGLAVGAAFESTFIPAMSDDDALASDAMGAFWLGDEEDWES